MGGWRKQNTLRASALISEEEGQNKEGKYNKSPESHKTEGFFFLSNLHNIIQTQVIWMILWSCILLFPTQNKHKTEMQGLIQRSVAKWNLDELNCLHLIIKWRKKPCTSKTVFKYEQTRGRYKYLMPLTSQVISLDKKKINDSLKFSGLWRSVNWNCKFKVRVMTLKGISVRHLTICLQT